MNLADELRWFEEFAGERIEMGAVGSRRRWLHGGPSRMVDPLPRGETLAALDWDFDAEIGSDEQFRPIYVWTASWLLVLTGQDGEVRLAWLPREPRRCAPEHLGAWYRGHHEAEVRSGRRVPHAQGSGEGGGRFVIENGPAAEEAEYDRRSGRFGPGRGPGSAIMPADPIASARLSTRIASLTTDGCGEADDAAGVEKGLSEANPNGTKENAADVNADGDHAGLAQLALMQTLATARDASNLIVADERGDLLFFLDLVDRTMRWLPARLRCVLFLDPRAPSTTLLLSDHGDELPVDLVEEWKSWTQRYDVLVAANSRLALADLLSKIDAALDGEEPRFMAEWRAAHLRRDDVPGPSWRQLRLLTAAFDDDPFPELRRLRRHAGGWVIRDQSTGALVFVQDPDLDGEPFV